INIYISELCASVQVFKGTSEIPPVLAGSSADTPRELSVLTGTDVTLGCVFDKLSKQVEWSALTVEWITVDKRGGKSIVYTFEDGKAHLNRAGSVVDKTRLLQSDASLKLCNVTVGDEGLYTLGCSVKTPSLPEKQHETSGLFAHPEISQE
uniref:Ig-like domain-containing protein n=1 Tax=Labrus bergylta TaxID=56723 RepID=A0A3Q3H393_9LABR